MAEAGAHRRGRTGSVGQFVSRPSFGPNISVTWLVILLWPLLAAISCVSEADNALAKEPVTLVSADGSKRTIKAEVMRTPEQLWIGLRWRDHLAEGEGMLFDLGSPRQATFTMQDTLIPLDMIFIGDDGRIVNIGAMREPGSLGPYLSDGPVRAVLELNGGAAAKYHLAPGDRVQSPLFDAPGSY